MIRLSLDLQKRVEKFFLLKQYHVRLRMGSNLTDWECLKEYKIHLNQIWRPWENPRPYLNQVNFESDVQSLTSWLQDKHPHRHFKNVIGRTFIEGALLNYYIQQNKYACEKLRLLRKASEELMLCTKCPKQITSLVSFSAKFELLRAQLENDCAKLKVEVLFREKKVKHIKPKYLSMKLEEMMSG